MSALRESRFRGTAQLNVPDGAAGDAESPKHFLPRPEPARSPTTAAAASTSADSDAASASAPPAAPTADPDGAVEAVDATLAVLRRVFPVGRHLYEDKVGLGIVRVRDRATCTRTKWPT